jgi:hypothetical protein
VPGWPHGRRAVGAANSPSVDAGLDRFKFLPMLCIHADRTL